MIRSIDVEKNMASRPSYYIKTYGCQMNVYDSEAIDGMLYERDYIPAGSEETADIIILNTCSVRDLAEQKAIGKMGLLGKLKRQNPNIVLGIAGCMAQNMKDDLLRRLPHLDIVCGPNDIFQLPDLVESALKGNRRNVLVNDKSLNVIGAHIPKRRTDKFHAWVAVMRGCNHCCTYCIVPRVRGKEVSRSPEDVMDEIEALAQAGYKEVTLLGQNINSYGRDLRRGINFPKLLEMINQIDGLKRIRFVTSHPVDIRDGLMHAIADLDHVCEYLHFPFQAGSNRILYLMKRGYTRETYLQTVEKLRSFVPNIALSTDVIVGFPGETDKEFEETLDLMKKIQFDGAYLFKYSVRSRTEAAHMPEQVREEVKIKRHAQILELHKEISYKKNLRYVGRTEEVLVERTVMQEKDVMDESQNLSLEGLRYQGRLRDNRLVYFKSDSDCVGQLVNVRINRSSSFSLYGEVLKNNK